MSAVGPTSGNSFNSSISSGSGSSGSTPDISGIGAGAGGYQGAAQAANSMAEQSSFQDSMIQLSHSMNDKAIGAFPTQA